MEKIKKVLLLRGISCYLYSINSLITETLGLQATEFTDLELSETLVELGSYLKKEVGN